MINNNCPHCSGLRDADAPPTGLSAVWEEYKVPILFSGFAVGGMFGYRYYKQKNKKKSKGLSDLSGGKIRVDSYVIAGNEIGMDLTFVFPELNFKKDGVLSIKSYNTGLLKRLKKQEKIPSKKILKELEKMFSKEIKAEYLKEKKYWTK